MAAHIDLGPLLALLTQVPTTANSANTPDMDPGSVGQFLNPNATDSSNIDTSQPYQTPTRMQQYFWPTQSGQINSLNNQVVSAPTLAEAANRATMGVRENNIKDMPPGTTPNVNPRSLAVMGYGNPNQTPSSVLPENTALGELQGGLPATRAQTALTQAQTELQQAKGGLARTPTTELALNQEAMNRLAQDTQVDPLQINLAHADFVAANQREPSENELKNYITQNQLQYQKTVVPPQTAEAASTARLGATLAGQREALSPFEEQTQGNRIMGEAAESQWMPPMEPYGNRINPENGTVTPIQRNPLGAYAPALAMRSIGELSGNKTMEIEGPSGRKYTIPTAMAPTGAVSILGPKYTPAGGLSIRQTVNPPLGGGSNNVTSTIPSNDTGSMSPAIPTSSSNTTLSHPSVNPPLPLSNLRNIKEISQGEQQLANSETPQKKHISADSLYTATGSPAMQFWKMAPRGSAAYEGGKKDRISDLNDALDNPKTTDTQKATIYNELAQLHSQ